MRGKNGLERFALLLRLEVFVPKDRVDLDVAEFAFDVHRGARHALENHSDLLHYPLARGVFFHAFCLDAIQLDPAEREFEHRRKRLSGVSLPSERGIQDVSDLPAPVLGREGGKAVFFQDKACFFPADVLRK